MQLPLLCTPTPGETFYLYLSISDQAVASALVREDEAKQQPIYFVSKVLHEVETRNSHNEKMAYALVILARKLQAYFDSHLVVVYTNYPLKQIFHKLDQLGRMLRWPIELYGLDLTFAPWTAIKAQALTDFLAEYSFSYAPTLDEKSDPSELGAWTIKVNSAVNSKGVGVGMIMTLSHGQFKGSRSIKLNSKLSNNQAEYEVLLIAMTWALAAGSQAFKGL